MRNVLLLTVTFALLLTVPAVTQTTGTPVPQAPAPDAPACTAAASVEAPALSEEAGGGEGIEQIGVPEPTAMVCADEWDEYRWVYAGCCSGNLKKTKKQRRHCCFNNGGTSCGGWVDTGATKCSGACPV